MLPYFHGPAWHEYTFSCSGTFCSEWKVVQATRESNINSIILYRLSRQQNVLSQGIYYMPRYPLTLLLAGGGLQKPPPRFSCAIAERLEIASWNSEFEDTLIADILWIFWPKVRTDHHVSSAERLSKINLQPRHGYSSPRVSMKLTGLHEVIITYKMLTSDFIPGDLRSGQFRDLPIISLWGNNENVSRFA